MLSNLRNISALAAFISAWRVFSAEIPADLGAKAQQPIGAAQALPSFPVRPTADAGKEQQIKYFEALLARMTNIVDRGATWDIPRGPVTDLKRFSMSNNKNENFLQLAQTVQAFVDQTKILAPRFGPYGGDDRRLDASARNLIQFGPRNVEQARLHGTRVLLNARHLIDRIASTEEGKPRPIPPGKIVPPPATPPIL